MSYRDIIRIHTYIVAIFSVPAEYIANYYTESVIFLGLLHQLYQTGDEQGRGRCIKSVRTG